MTTTFTRQLASYVSLICLALFSTTLVAQQTQLVPPPQTI